VASEVNGVSRRRGFNWAPAGIAASAIVALALRIINFETIFTVRAAALQTLIKAGATTLSWLALVALGFSLGWYFGRKRAALRSREEPKWQVPGLQETDNRHNEIAAGAKFEFLSWRAKFQAGIPVSGNQILSWLESGGTARYHEFDHGLLGRMVKMLCTDQEVVVACPTRKEYESALATYRARMRARSQEV